MNYPAIKQGDKVRYKVGGTDFKTTVEIEDNGEIYIDTYDCGYQDDPQLMTSRITNFRIIERADGTPVFMEDDIVLGASVNELKVLAVNNDSFLHSYSDNHELACGWRTFQEAYKNGWKLKGKAEPEPKEVTMEEVCAKFGENVKIKKG